MQNKLPHTLNFLFVKPDDKPELSDAANTAIALGAISSRLVQIERTRTVHPDGRAENVAEHSLMLSKVAPELASALYPELDANLVASYSSLHDDLEAYVGDTPTDILASSSLTKKDELETAALQQLLQEYGHMPHYASLIQQYESQSTPEARFVRAVDKLMVLLIHLPNDGAVLRRHYARESFLEAEQQLLARDGYKYGEFELIKDLRIELGQYIADAFLS